jgi:hypothetical protein
MTCTDSDDNDMKNTYARVNKDRQKDPTWKTLRDPMSERYDTGTQIFHQVRVLRARRSKKPIGIEVLKVHNFRRRSSAIINIFTKLHSKTGFVKMLVEI